LARGERIGALATLFAETARRAVDWALPPRCLTCDDTVLEQGVQCAACFRGLGHLRPPFCDRCGVPLRHAGQAEGTRDVPLCPRKCNVPWCLTISAPAGRGQALYSLNGFGMIGEPF